jgi:hypothetical protein
LQLQQRLWDPVQQLAAGNCHLTRDTAAVVRASSFVPQPLPPLPFKPGSGALLQAGVVVYGSDGHGGVASSGPGFGAGGLPASANGSVDLWRFELQGVGLIAPHIAGLLRTPL